MIVVENLFGTQENRMSNVIDISDILEIKEVRELLELSESHATIFFCSLKAGGTLAEALREIEITSASQIHLDIWPDLRSWRDRNFPLSVKVK